MRWLELLLMQADYAAFIDRMIDKYEGGYGWDKSDPGGPTNFGITCYDLAEHRDQKMDSMTRWAPIVKAMPRSEARAIYATKYATWLQFDALPPGPDCCMLDYGVNSGKGRPVRVARALLGKGTGDRMTLDLLREISVADAKWFVESMCKERLHFMHQIRGGSAWTTFGKGWLRRVNDLEAYCEHLIGKTATPPPAPTTPVEPTPKATNPTKPPTPDKIGTGAGTVVVGGAGAAVNALGVPVWIIAIVVGCVLVGVVAFLLWKRAAAKKANETVVIPPNVRPRP